MEASSLNQIYIIPLIYFILNLSSRRPSMSSEKKGGRQSIKSRNSKVHYRTEQTTIQEGKKFNPAETFYPDLEQRLRNSYPEGHFRASKKRSRRSKKSKKQEESEQTDMESVSHERKAKSIAKQRMSSKKGKLAEKQKAKESKKKKEEESNKIKNKNHPQTPQRRSSSKKQTTTRKSKSQSKSKSKSKSKTKRSSQKSKGKSASKRSSSKNRSASSKKRDSKKSIRKTNTMALTIEQGKKYSRGMSNKSRTPKRGSHKMTTRSKSKSKKSNRKKVKKS